jgi:hypothetical protein
MFLEHRVKGNFLDVDKEIKACGDKLCQLLPPAKEASKIS